MIAYQLNFNKKVHFTYYNKYVFLRIVITDVMALGKFKEEIFELSA
jgi:hypothetical protein